ncbi:hypothetical protein K504DRAFT_399619 [Pleomassaria siparia CBS 279.74]|uniref:Uncharacterized protein n=1 Tax=Pleomassaria siparia CBS 279.74 TaxID=1314801 RepID=A0A6G1KMA5_9PLEO|nr:hypothetical protein K504DRAFT_399619 [Pleomassaria siparia CBS 279.74]
MASSSTDAHSQPKRPPAMARQSSTSPQVSQSPPEGVHHKPTSHKTQRQHVVGTARVQRNASAGKNLNKLNKTAAGDSNAAKHHRRSHSGNSTSAPSSPRPGFKRNASSGGIVRVANHTHTHTALRKNHSSGHLARLGSSKNMLKSSKSEVAPARKTMAQQGRSRQSSPEDHPTVHFDVGDVDDNDDDDDDDEHDDGWTEESASQSPTTTRSNTRANTRSNSVILDPQTPMGEPTGSVGETTTEEEDSFQSHPPPSALTQTLTDRTHSPRQLNGSSGHSHSRPPDADMITSRLLQRSSSHNPPPQMSAIAATVLSNTNDVRDLSRSAGSTLVDTPGRDLVSRFMDGDGSAGTPKDSSSFLPSRGSPHSGGGELDQSKRNKSMPNVAGTDSRTPTNSKSHSRRSGTGTPSTDLPPSRTQQKLMLQRASSSIEPQKLVPVILPRTGGPTFTSGMTYTASGEGRLDPRLQQQFNHVTIEYKVVRRYRNPLADALVRMEQMPGTPRRGRVPRLAGTNGFVNVHGSNSLSTSFNDSTVETEASGPRRSRVSFDHGRASRDEGDVDGRRSFESENDRVRNEVEEVCRRLWESTEVVEGD